eukprot:11165906-Lingulodinium_polyedra.AAC.1
MPQLPPQSGPAGAPHQTSATPGLLALPANARPGLLTRGPTLLYWAHWGGRRGRPAGSSEASWRCPTRAR